MITTLILHALATILPLAWPVAHDRRNAHLYRAAVREAYNSPLGTKHFPAGKAYQEHGRKQMAILGGAIGLAFLANTLLYIFYQPA